MDNLLLIVSEDHLAAELEVHPGQPESAFLGFSQYCRVHSLGDLAAGTVDRNTVAPSEHDRGVTVKCASCWANTAEGLDHTFCWCFKVDIFFHGQIENEPAQGSQNKKSLQQHVV